jgi:hypothetical protein
MQPETVVRNEVQKPQPKVLNGITSTTGKNIKTTSSKHATTGTRLISPSSRSEEMKKPEKLKTSLGEACYHPVITIC